MKEFYYLSRTIFLLEHAEIDRGEMKPLPSCSALQSYTNIRLRFEEVLLFDNTLYIGYTAIGYGAKLGKGGVLGCPDLPTVNLIGYNPNYQLQCGVKSVIMQI